MNHTIIFIALFVATVVAIVGGYLMLSRQPTSPDQQSMPIVTPNTTTIVPIDARSPEDVKAAFQNEIAPYNDDNVKLYETVVVGGWAIQAWMGDVRSGEALLKYEAAQSKWILVSGGGGVWTVESLVDDMGVPPATAEALLRGLPR